MSGLATALRRVRAAATEADAEIIEEERDEDDEDEADRWQSPRRRDVTRPPSSAAE